MRKNKKDDQLLKRRNIEKDEPTSPLQENNAQNYQSPITMSLDEIVNSIHCGNTQKEFMAVQAVRKMLSREKNPPIDTIIGLDLVPKLIQYLDNSNEWVNKWKCIKILLNPLFFHSTGIQFESAWALTNISSGTSEQTKAVISAGAVPKFVNLLASKAPNVAEQAVWALGNIAGDGPEARDIVLEYHVVDYLMKLLARPNSEVRSPYYSRKFQK